MSRLTNLRDFQQNDSSNFVLFTESQHCGVFSVQLLPDAQNWVFVNKPSKKLLQNCKVRKFVKTKMKNGHSWGDYNFLLFYRLSTSSKVFLANVETNPQIMSSNQVGKTLTVTDNLPSLVLWEMATLLQVSSSKKKHAVSQGMRQFSTTLSVFSMWPNVINLVVIHTLFVYAGTWDHFEAWESHDENVTKTLFKIERSSFMTYWWMPACSCSAYLCCPFGDRNAKRVTKEDEFPLANRSLDGVVDKFQSWTTGPLLEKCEMINFP